MSSRAAGALSQAVLTKYYRRSSTVPKIQPEPEKLCAYPVAPTVSPAAHSSCRQLHAMDGRFAEPSQYAPQYLLPGAAGQLQPGCAHFSIFFSGIEPPWLLFQLPKSILPAPPKINPSVMSKQDSRQGKSRDFAPRLFLECVLAQISARELWQMQARMHPARCPAPPWAKPSWS